MKFQPKTHILKSGISISIRTPVKEEAQRLVRLKRSYIENTSTIPMNLEEYPDDPNNELRLITEYEESPNSILLVAENKDELIGNIDLTGSKRKKMFHTGMIGMGIKKEWRNQGLGKYLISSVIEWAQNSSPIEIIWLDVYASNELGMHLYKNMGFIESGIIHDFFKDKNGYKDKVQMYQRIKEKTYHNNI